MDTAVNHWSSVFESLLLEADMSKEQPLFYVIVDPHANHPPITIVSKERQGQLESVLGSHRIVSGALPPHPAGFKQSLHSWNQIIYTIDPPLWKCPAQFCIKQLCVAWSFPSLYHSIPITKRWSLAWRMKKGWNKFSEFSVLCQPACPASCCVKLVQKFAAKRVACVRCSVAPQVPICRRLPKPQGTENTLRLVNCIWDRYIRCVSQR